MSRAKDRATWIRKAAWGFIAMGITYPRGPANSFCRLCGAGITKNTVVDHATFHLGAIDERKLKAIEVMMGIGFSRTEIVAQVGPRELGHG